MSVLTLTTLRCPDGVPIDSRRVTGGEFSIGRGADCDWILSDPTKAISKRHCVIEFAQGGWQVRDTSTNGTFLDEAGERIERGQARPLLDGSRLIVGPYEIQVKIAAAPAAELSPAGLPGLAVPGQGGPGLEGPGMGAPMGAAPLMGLPPLPGLGLPSDRSPSDASRRSASPATPIQPAAFNPLGPDLSANPSPGLPGRSPIPADFDPALDMEPVADIAPPQAAAFSPPKVVQSPQDDPFGHVHLQTILPQVSPSSPPAPAPLPPAMPATTAVEPQPVAAPLPRPAVPAAQHPAPGGELSAFLHGAGIEQAVSGAVRDRGEETLHRAGILLKHFVAGLRALIVSRADVKREFRIQQTVIRQGTNNALKFGASDQHALVALLEAPGNPETEVKRVVKDLLVHQIATLAATQVAAKALLDRLDPKRLEQEDTGGGLLPGARERRLWEAYKTLHREVSDKFYDDFDSVFGKEFARAYEDESARRSD